MTSFQDPLESGVTTGKKHTYTPEMLSGYTSIECFEKDGDEEESSSLKVSQVFCVRDRGKVHGV